MRRLVILVILVVVTLLLAPAVRAQAPVPADARSRLLVTERAVSALSAGAGLAGALRSVADTTLAVLWEGAPIASGKATALALLGAQPALQGARVQWQPMHVEVSRDSSIGVTWGVVALDATSADTGRSPLRFGRYLAGWRRGADGTWRLAAVAWTGIVARGERTVLPPGLTLGAPARGAGVPSHARGPADADRAFAARALAADAGTAFAEFATPDGVAFAGTGELVMGPEAIRALFGAGPRSRWVWGPVLADAAASDDLGWTIGEAEITPEGAPSPIRSKYLSLWRRTPAGWRYLADGGNSRP